MQNTTLASLPPTRLMDKRIPFVLACVTTAAIGLYLFLSFNDYRVGFPLDDAWIHQTYARSLAQTGRWEFFPGQPSAGGSTAPLWSFLLAIAHFFRINIYFWTFLLGALCLWGTSTIAEWTARRMIGNYRPVIPWVGILVASEWHLVWAAVSGMETSLHIFLVLLFFALILNEHQNMTLPGLIVGVSVWVRPDGVTLLIPLFFSILMAKSSLQTRLKKGIHTGIGFSVLVIPYLLFNLALTGTLMPNTFYAKQTEYAVLQQIPLYQRFYEQTLQPLTGAGIMLLPGFLFSVYRAIQKHDWTIISICLWLIIYLGMYAVRLPVTYQHGRYAMPIIAIFLLIGSLASVEWFTLRVNQVKTRPFQHAWAFSTGLICAAFLIIGAWAYARDVTIIESKMVNTAQWVAKNIPSDNLIAAHDIGALGYFGAHPLMDLAGLISPEIIPVMRDQTRLAELLNKTGVRYLVSFPNWYPDLIKGKTEIFNSGSAFGKPVDGENMAVYRWK